MFQISSLTTEEGKPEAGEWIQELNAQKVSYGPQLKKALPQILRQSAVAPAQSDEDSLYQLVAFELARRGFIVPSDKSSTEREHLVQLGLTTLPPTGFYFLPKAYPHAVPPDADLAFIGAPTDLGASKPGTRNGPSLLREKSYSYCYRGGSPGSVYNLSTGKVSFEGLKAYDTGDIRLERATLDEWLLSLQKAVEALPPSTLPFLVGGDHSLTLAAIRALTAKGKKNFTLVQLDSHLDLQIWGEFSQGKPENLSAPIHSNFVSHVLNENPGLKLFQIGSRNYQSIPAQSYDEVHSYIQTSGPKLTDLDLLTREFSELEEHLPKDQEIYLSIDVDILSSASIQNTGYPAATGPDLAKVLKLIRKLTERNTLIGVDIMEFGSTSSRESQAREAEIINYLILQIVEKVQRK